MDDPIDSIELHKKSFKNIVLNLWSLLVNFGLISFAA